MHASNRYQIFKKKFKTPSTFCWLNRYEFMELLFDEGDADSSYPEILALQLADYSTRHSYQFQTSPDIINPQTDKCLILIHQPESWLAAKASYYTLFLNPIYDTNSTFVCFSQRPHEHHR